MITKTVKARQILILWLIAAMLTVFVPVLLMGCAGTDASAKVTTSFDYEVSTGDRIKISLDGAKYKLSAKGEDFFVTDTVGNAVCWGTFGTMDVYDKSVDFLTKSDGTDNGVKVIDARDGFLFWEQKNKSYIVQVVGDTAVVFDSDVGSDILKDVYNLVSLSKV